MQIDSDITVKFASEDNHVLCSEYSRGTLKNKVVLKTQCLTVSGALTTVNTDVYLNYLRYKTSFSASQRTPFVSITKTSRQMVFSYKMGR
jgi:hypothetical protein